MLGIYLHDVRHLTRVCLNQGRNCFVVVCLLFFKSATRGECFPLERPKYKNYKCLFFVYELLQGCFSYQSTQASFKKYHFCYVRKVSSKLRFCFLTRLTKFPFLLPHGDFPFNSLWQQLSISLDSASEGVFHFTWVHICCFERETLSSWCFRKSGLGTRIKSRGRAVHRNSLCPGSCCKELLQHTSQREKKLPLWWVVLLFPLVFCMRWWVRINHLCSPMYQHNQLFVLEVQNFRCLLC